MKLDYNKVISQKLDDYDEDEYKKLKEKKRRDDKKTLGRPEWVYYLWYLHLKLCLEIEEKKIPLQRRRKYRSGVQVQRKVSHIHRLKINRKVYEGIDWDDLKNLPWSQWKKRYLDVFMSGDIRKIQHGDEWKCEPQYLYLEVDLRNTETVLVNQMKKILRGENRKNLPSRLGIQGRPHYHTLVLGYNIIVGMIEGEDWFKTVTRDENIGRMKELLDKEVVKENLWETIIQGIRKGDTSQEVELEKFCYNNLHRYILRTQRVLYNVSQGRFYDDTDVSKEKWKDSWSPKSFTW